MTTTIQASSVPRSVAHTGPMNPDEMPDPDNLRVDTTTLPVLPTELRSAPSIGERLTLPRHRAEFSRSA
jgi:hypothetical protein